jgi:hypothetical protein
VANNLKSLTIFGIICQGAWENINIFWGILELILNRIAYFVRNRQKKPLHAPFSAKKPDF